MQHQNLSKFCLSQIIFDARAGADALHSALYGPDIDEQCLIDILCHRTSCQKIQILQAYKSGYDEVKRY